jgi:hypothetical protein
MKKHKLFIVLLICCVEVASGRSWFSGSIIFKGRAEGESFIGENFSIRVKDPDFLVSRKDDENVLFRIKHNKNLLTDLVFSSAGTASAATLHAMDQQNRDWILMTVNSDGKERIFRYKAYKMTEKVGWVVELGAVSNSGKLILAKCAIPSEEGDSMVIAHRWMILEIKNNKILIISAKEGIENWVKIKKED